MPPEAPDVCYKRRHQICYKNHEPGPINPLFQLLFFLKPRFPVSPPLNPIKCLFLWGKRSFALFTPPSDSPLGRGWNRPFGRDRPAYSSSFTISPARSAAMSGWTHPRHVRSFCRLRPHHQRPCPEPAEGVPTERRAVSRYRRTQACSGSPLLYLQSRMPPRAADLHPTSDCALLCSRSAPCRERISQIPHGIRTGREMFGSQRIVNARLQRWPIDARPDKDDRLPAVAPYCDIVLSW